MEEILSVVPELSPQAQVVLEKRYLKNGEKPDELFRRVAKAVSSAEEDRSREWEDKFYEMMVRLDFLPNSPTLMNAGSDNGGTLSACYVLPLNDSMESIMKTATDQAMVEKFGGGVGFPLSNLRPKGTPIKSTQGKACGPISVLQVLSKVGTMITQGGKRDGAHMAVMEVYHPDIEEFIDCKKTEGTIHNFNISVGVDSNFMEAVKEDQYIELCWPMERKRWQELPSGKIQHGDQTRWLKDSKYIKARYLFDKITQGAWSNGEPGLVWLDRINQDNSTPALGEIQATNPCWSGDTKVWTLYGPKTFRELAESGNDIPVLTQKDNRLVFKMMRHPHRTRKNSPLVRIVFEDGSSLRCTPDHQIVKKDGSKVNALDLQVGDRLASVYRHKANQSYFRLTNGSDSPLEHHVVAEWKYGRRPDYPAEYCNHVDDDKSNNLIGVWDEKSPLFKYDVRENKSSKECRLVNVNHKIAGISHDGYDDVYNGMVDDTHTYFVMCGNNDAILSANCGEQPLLGNESCNLGSINLGNFVIHWNSSIAVLDEERLRETVRLAVRFLDNVVSINNHPTDATRIFNGTTRKIGLGIMGWADFLVRMRIPYDSEEALELAKKVGQIIKDEADETSSHLGEIKDSFPAFKDSPINVKNGGKWNAMRNAWRLSIAPTGTISMIADCSSGIEPLYALAYKKHNMSAALANYELYYVNKDYKSAVAQRKMLAPGLEITDSWIGEQNSDDLLVGVDKAIFKVASEISPEWHMKMQAEWQPYIDSGISKTINLPSTATVEDIQGIYMHAWEMGCKGITVYREGSREKEVLVKTISKVGNSTKSEKNSKIKKEPVSRPHIMRGITPRVRTGHGMLYVTVNSDENGPFEVFSTLGKAGQCEPAHLEAISRLISLALRSGINVNEVVRQLRGIICCPVWDNGKHIKSLPDAISHILSSDKIEANRGTMEELSVASKMMCPECEADMFLQEGCKRCPECGFGDCV